MVSREGKGPVPDVLVRQITGVSNDVYLNAVKSALLAGFDPESKFIKLTPFCATYMKNGQLTKRFRSELSHITSGINSELFVHLEKLKGVPNTLQITGGVTERRCTGAGDGKKCDDILVENTKSGDKGEVKEKTGKVVVVWREVSLPSYEDSFASFEKKWFEDSKRSEVDKWALQIAGALAALHGKKVVYRNLKLSSVKLDEKDDIVLCDFEHAVGVSRKNLTMDMASLGWDEEHRNDAGAVFLPPPTYLPREITMDLRLADSINITNKGRDPERYKKNLLKCDVYSFGVMFYLLYSRDFDAYSSVLQGNAPDLRNEDNWGRVDERYRTLLRQCVDSVAENRPTFEVVLAHFKPQEASGGDTRLRDDSDDDEERQGLLVDESQVDGSQHAWYKNSSQNSYEAPRRRPKEYTTTTGLQSDFSSQENGDVLDDDLEAIEAWGLPEHHESLPLVPEQPAKRIKEARKPSPLSQKQALSPDKDVFSSQGSWNFEHSQHKRTVSSDDDEDSLGAPSLI